MAKGVVFHLTSPVTLAFPNLITARAFSAPGRKPGEPRFDAMFLFEPTHPDVPAIGVAMQQAAAQEFPGGLPAAFKWPFVDGNDRAAKQAQKNRDGSAFAGKYILSAHTGAEYPPGLTAVINGQAKDLFGDERAAMAGRYFYGGVKVIATVNFVPYPEGNGPAGVTAYLQVITSLNLGDRDAKLEAGAKSGSSVHSAQIAQHVGHVSMANPMTPGFPGVPGLVTTAPSFPGVPLGVGSLV